MKRTSRILSILTAVVVIGLLSLVSPFGAEAQECDRMFAHLSLDDGLTANHVKAILRDKEGFLWVGTPTGLNRYDGSTVKRYDVYDLKMHRGDNNVGYIYEAPDGILWLGTDSGIYLYAPKSDTVSYMESSDGMSWVQDIVGDTDGNTWVLSPDQGIYRFRGDDKTLYPIPGDARFKEDYFTDLCMSGDGELWATGSNGKIYKYNSRNDIFKEVRFNFPDTIKRKYSRMLADDNGGFILSTEDVELFHLQPDDNLSVRRIPFNYDEKLYFRSMEVIDNKVWIGTPVGLFNVDIANGAYRLYNNNPVNPHSLSDNTVYVLYADSARNLWIGTMFGGVDAAFHSGLNFCPVGPFDKTPIRVRGLAYAPAIALLAIGSEANGAYLYNPLTSTYSPTPQPLALKRATTCVTYSDGMLLVGLERDGLTAYQGGGSPYRYLPKELSDENTVYAYLRDSRGTEWVGLGYALYRKQKEQQDFERVKATGYAWIFTLCQTPDGDVWIGTMDNGLYRYSYASKAYKQYTGNADKPLPDTLHSNTITALTVDRKGRLWISTAKGGLSRYNKEHDNFTTFGRESGLPGRTVYNLLEDKRGQLWFGTDNGLVCLDPDKRDVIVYTKADGLPSNVFTYNSAAAVNDSTFYFGTTHGVFRFNPLRKTPHAETYPIRFSGFISSDSIHLDGNIIYSEQLKLAHDRNTFSINVGVPSAIGVKGVKQFYYRLLPSEKDWIRMDGTKIAFTNLAPGAYTLEVKMECGEIVSEGSLKIIISSPWWATVWAKTGYCLIALGVIALLFLAYRRRELRRLHERQEAFASNKEKEVYRQKLNFFTEIAHEIRTPLSLISLPLEAMEENGLDHPESANYLKVTRENTARLLELTSQLLDFQKIEAGRLRLKPEATDLVELVNYTIERFEPAMRLKDKSIIRPACKENIITVTDKEAVTKIISNLLNNALKYAMTRIGVSIEKQSDSVKIKIASDGEKISEENRERIFETFYQTDKSQEQKNGVGIGLPLSRSLAGLLGGTLYLETSEGSDNVFVLTLPLTQSAVAETPVQAATLGESIIYEEDSNQTSLNANGYHVLLVEDNEGIRSMLANRLSSSFLITLAANGREALDLLAKQKVDIIVTDIMMPEMDGLELCRRLKADPDLSHIPVVFITAKNDLDSKVKGLQIGAEAYIEKPFSVKYLREMVVTLLENRRRAREAFATKPFFQAENIPVNKEDEKFMEKVLAIIKENMGNEDFNVEALGDKMCMSRSNLLRHVKGVFNLSPSELIRVIRLKTAAELIKTGAYTLGEISDMIGISSQSYFTKMFFKQFNVMPNEFARQVQEDTQKQKS